MASEITYAEVRFKNESNSSGTYSDSAAVPKEKPIPHLRKPGCPSLLFTSLMALLLLLAISFFVAFISLRSQAVCEYKLNVCRVPSSWDELVDKKELGRQYPRSVLQLIPSQNYVKSRSHLSKWMDFCSSKIQRILKNLKCTQISIFIYFQKYFQLLEEKKAMKALTYTELNCLKNHSHIEDKVWSCCPKDWKPFGSYCYFIPTDPTDAASWTQSEEKCSSRGAHLMVVHSKEEQDFITRFLEPKAAYFIGLSDQGHRQWRWVDQTPYNENTTFWHSGEPSGKNEKCVIVNHVRSAWGWNDILCIANQKSICQMKKIYL